LCHPHLSWGFQIHAALASLTRGWTAEYSPAARVNAVAPGPIAGLQQLCAPMPRGRRDS
jgi:NAD(P)-dependent dehydrogenase (short-subunit alcohol dehydrogenase family)